MSELREALDHLSAGRWREAHVIVQEDDTSAGAWLHGIVHILEGDLDNAKYWYRKAHRPFPGAEAVAGEIEQARRTLDA